MPILYEEETFLVRTAHGAITAYARPVILSGGVIFLTRSRKIGRGNDGFCLPSGTPLVTNQRLVERTEGRVTHMIVRDGLYRLFSQAKHISGGTAEDLVGMNATVEELIGYAEFLRRSGQLSLDYHDRVRRALEKIGNDLGSPKQNRHKLKTSERSRQAARTRYHDGRIKPGPGRVVTAAAATHALKRVSELEEMCPAVNFTMFRIYRLMRELHRILDGQWELFTDDMLDGLPVPIQMALVNGTHDPQSVLYIDDVLEGFELRLKRMFFIQPFAPLAARLVKALRGLRRDIRAHLVARVYERSLEITELLRRLRMIRYVELQLLARLSAGLNDERRDVILKRHAMLLDRVHDMGDKELHPFLRREIVEYLELFRDDIEYGEAESAKDFLKDLTALLATA